MEELIKILTELLEKRSDNNRYWLTLEREELLKVLEDYIKITESNKAYTTALEVLQNMSKVTLQPVPVTIQGLPTIAFTEVNEQENTASPLFLVITVEIVDKSEIRTI